MKQVTHSKVQIKISRIESFAGTKLQWAEEQIESDITTFCGLAICSWSYQRIVPSLSEKKNKVTKLEIAVKPII